MRAYRATMVALALVSASAAPALAQTPATPQFSAYDGTVGPYPIGMQLNVAPDQRTVLGGHYFYASKQIDIPLRPVPGPAPVDVAEPGGGVFHLRFVGNGSEHGAPLNFYNSIGLAGSWTQGARTLPVKLALGTAGDVPAPGRRYAMIGDAPDAVVEANARRFLDGVTHGDRVQAASAVSYPLRVNFGPRRHLSIANRAALLAAWPRIFPPALVAKLRTAVPHDMFVNDEGAAVANGAVWFDDKGASMINVGP